MGIKGLSKLLATNAPNSMKEAKINQYFGRIIAIDASITVYQFIAAVRDAEGATMVDEFGETTSHIIGTFYRTIKLLSIGIKPVFVFDGKPPEMKSDELQKRTDRAKEAAKQLEQAKEDGDLELQKKLTKRTSRMTKEQSNEVKKLLELMGVPCIEASCEAEGTCAELVKKGKCYGTATEDMDALTLGSKIVLRKFTGGDKDPIREIDLDRALQEMGFTMDMFIDLCILLGCDYCDTIKGIGPVRAFELIRNYKSIEEILKHIDKNKYKVPDTFKYKEARELFVKPDVNDVSDLDLQWKKPDVEGVVEYLVKEKHFGEERVRKGLEKLKDIKSKGTQGRLDTFFKVTKAPLAPKTGGKKRPTPANKKTTILGKKKKW
ncbi:Flap endonuclease [Entamoeba marina]